MAGEQGQDEAALEQLREAFRERNATSEEERTKFPRPERFSDFAIGFAEDENEHRPLAGERDE